MDPLKLVLRMVADWTDPVVVRDAPERVSYVIEQLIEHIEALRAAGHLALTALPDSDIAGPDGGGYKFAWDELGGDEQEWVKFIRRTVAGVLEGE